MSAKPGGSSFSNIALSSLSLLRSDIHALVAEPSCTLYIRRGISSHIHLPFIPESLKSSSQSSTNFRFSSNICSPQSLLSYVHEGQITGLPRLILNLLIIVRWLSPLNLRGSL